MIRRLPFYGSYALFERLMSLLKDKGVPRKIDSGFLLPNLGSDSARAVSGLMGNGWIDDDHVPSSDLRKLVDAYRSDAWAPVLREVLTRAYSYVPGDWTEIAPSELHQSFVKHVGKEPDALRSCERFFLSAIQDAGIKPSVDFANRTVRLRQSSSASSEIKSHSGMNISDVRTYNYKSAPDSERIMQLLDLVDDDKMPENIKAAAFTLISYFKQRARNADRS
jgi:hypothetical protein